MEKGFSSWNSVMAAVKSFMSNENIHKHTMIGKKDKHTREVGRYINKCVWIIIIIIIIFFFWGGGGGEVGGGNQTTWPKPLPDPKSLATFSHAPGGIQNPYWSQRQLAVSGNALYHMLIRAGPQWWETASSQWQRLRPHGHQGRPLVVRDS